MNRTIVPMLALLILAMPIMAFLGCGGDHPTGPAPNPGPDWPNALALPATDTETLDAVLALLADLREDPGIDAARDTLLARMVTGWPGLASAHLGTDGVTITLRFDDGAEAVLFTDESAFGAWIAPEPTLDAPAGSVGADKAALGCGDVVAPPNRKVHIVNVAGASNPETLGYTADLRQHLLDLGWDSDDIVISERSSFDDRSITPDTVFDQEGYGIVLFIGHGGFLYDDLGNEYFTLQAFRGGSYDGGYQDYVDEARWEQYRNWFHEGRLVSSTVWCEPDSAYQAHVSIRDDLLAEQMTLEEGALVSFICCNSIQLDDELTSLGAGSVLGWDGSMNGFDGMNTWRALLSALSDPDDPQSDAEALDTLHRMDLGYSSGHAGERTEMELGGDERDWRLPVSPEFRAPTDCLPDGAATCEFSVHFPDCPELDTESVVEIGGTVTLPPMAPATAEIEVRIADASGNTLAAGLFERDLGAGVGPIDLCPCEGGLQLDLTGYPDMGMYAAASADIELSYGDPTLAGASYDLGLPLTNLDGLIPGQVTLDVAVLSEAGDVLGTTTITEDVHCGDPRTASFCIGWLSVSAANYPTDATEIRVTAPNEPHALPTELSFPPDGTGGLYGFALGSTVSLEAEAFNGLGVSLGTAQTEVTIGCGENEVDVAFSEFGIILEASPEQADPDGQDQIVVTATLRGWQDGDVAVPSGDPVAGETVTFDTSLGNFVGGDQGVSDGAGRVSVPLVSDEAGLATVRAFVVEAGVESSPIQVSFGNLLTYVIDQLPVDYSGYDETDHEDWWISWYCCVFERWHNDELRLRMDDDGYLYTFIRKTQLQVGDTLRLRWTPIGGCWDGPSELSPVYLHYFFSTDYEHQVTVQLFPGVDPLTGVADMEHTFVNPLAAGPRFPGPSGADCRVLLADEKK